MSVPHSPEPTVFIVDDDEAVRLALAASLQMREMRVAGFQSAEHFLAAYRADEPGCLVLDLKMPGMSGLELQERLIAEGCTLPIILISGFGTVPDAVRAMKNFAIDFEKPYQLSALLKCIDQALARDAHARAQYASREQLIGRFAGLTGREYEVLQQLISGAANLTNKQIAKALKISHRTVAEHRTKILAKTGARSLTELAEMARLAGMRPR